MIKEHGIMLSAEYFPSTVDHTHPLELVLRDEQLRSHVKGIWIPNYLTNDGSSIMEIGRICSGLPFVKREFHASHPYHEENIGGEYSVPETNEKPNPPLPIPMVINACLDGGASDVAEQATRFTHLNNATTIVTISPSARGVGINAIKTVLSDELANGQAKLYMVATYPEDVPEEVMEFEAISEEAYTARIAAHVKNYNLGGVVGFAGLAGNTLPGQQLVSMGVYKHDRGYYSPLPVNSRSNCDVSNSTEFPSVFKRTKTPEQSIDGATYDPETGLCNTVMLLGKAMTDSVHDDLGIRKDTPWDSDEGAELIAHMQENILSIVHRADGAAA